jgi:hypothetical protein
MPTFRKRPVKIEARELTVDTADQVARWCAGRVEREAKPSDITDVRTIVRIPTLEGVMTATLGDWVIRGVQGEFYPCKPNIFTTTYEEC